MKLESLLRSINRRLVEISDYFGMKSVEYHKALNSIYSAIGSDTVDILIREPEKGRPTQLSRSSRALEGWSYFQSELQQAWDKVKEQGTVKQQAQRRISELHFKTKAEKKKAKGDWKQFQSTLSDLSKAEYESRYGDSDLYEIIQDEISKENDLPEDERDYIYIGDLERALDQFSSHKPREYRYSRAEEIFLKAKADHEMRLRAAMKEDADEEFEYNDKDDLDMSV